ncbi:hypothetical protein CROQUDRAFT_52083 [Cronartium quercuum f. sp. fusiforme G11]|uniref:CCHC-type domain-containing protein n=1 Tax=Cronartium quercuum f. sp. fusiforme G11 TaxID=708437 RepID=A0A9P6NBY0_9BASI|nr:hypothetical protein CROQUDRAFT_52083 [Cronartium quercuum f. sp. fusiforme G11]
MQKDSRRIEDKLRTHEAQLNKLDAQKTCLDELHRKIDALTAGVRPVHPLPANPSSWANVAASSRAAVANIRTNTSAVQPPFVTPPQTKVLNELKPSWVVIRGIKADKEPFADASLAKIVDDINFALMNIDARLPNSESMIQVKGTARLPGGHIKLFTSSRAEARWILANRNAWSEMADLDFLTSVATHPTVLHTVPALSNMEAELFIESLTEQNSAVKDGDILSFRWLGNPSETKKSHGSIVLNITNKELARKIEKGGLFYNYEYLRGSKYNKPSVPQCFRCLEVGHIAALCKAVKPTCVRCGGNHDLRNCAESRKTPVCVRCIKKDKDRNNALDIDTDDVIYAHSAYSAKCPLKLLTPPIGNTNRPHSTEATQPEINA